MTEETRELLRMCIGDLGVARRHLHRLRNEELQYSRGLAGEIRRSVEDCVQRIENALSIHEQMAEQEECVSKQS